MPTATVKLELQLDVGAFAPDAFDPAAFQVRGWTNMATDWFGSTVTGKIGSFDMSPATRLSETGELMFALKNWADPASGRLQGWYSPFHANVRAGFRHGIGVRLTLSDGVVSKVIFRGTLRSILPTAGKYGEQITQCIALDWMDDAARAPADSVTVQVDKRLDELATTLVALVPAQPASTSYATGLSTFPYAFQNVTPSSTVRELLHDAIKSEHSYGYVKGDGTLVVENRDQRATVTTVTATFAETMIALEIPDAGEVVLNQIRATLHRTRVDAAATTVLAVLDRAVPLAPSETRTFYANYTDPAQRATQIAGTAFVDPPVSGTDFVMNSLETGLGVNLTSSLTATAVFETSRVLWTLTNTGTQPGWVTTLGPRGKGLYDYGPVTFLAEDATSQTSYGLNAVALDLPFQADIGLGQGLADLELSLRKDPLNGCRSVTFHPLVSSALLTAALACVLGTKVAMSETMTGLAAARTFFVQGISFTIERAWLTWTLALVPADTRSYFIVDLAGYDTLDATPVQTTVGYP